MYHFRKAISLKSVSKADQEELVEDLAGSLAYDYEHRRPPLIGRDFGHQAAIRAVQKFYDELAEDPDYKDITRAIERLNLEVATESRGKFEAWLRKRFKNNHALDLWYRDSLEEACNEFALRVATQYFNGVVKRLEKLDGKSCYRLMELPKDVDPASLKKVGIYWSVDPQRVGVFGASPHRQDQDFFYWRFRAKIDPRAVDLRTTLEANLEYEFGKFEQEVTMKEGAKIWIFDVQLIRGYDYAKNLKEEDYELGEKVRINAWRKA